MNMTACLLVGGKGTRLRELGHNKPKCLINVAGKTILEHQFDMLLLNGITQVVLCTDFLADQVADAVKMLEYPYRNMDIHCYQSKDAGTAGSLLSAKEVCGGEDNRPWVAMNGDVFCPELKLVGPEMDCVQIAVKKVQEQFGKVSFEHNTRGINYFEEKQEYYASVGAYVFGRQSTNEDWILSNERSLEKETWPRLVKLGKMKIWHYHGPWFDLGTPERIAECEAWLSTRKK